MDNIQQLFGAAVEHRNSHQCSAMPYENGEKLVEVITKNRPNQILEIGTGCGYTATIMALANPQTHIDTLEKDPEHVQIAQEFIYQHTGGASKQITIINKPAEEFFEEVNKLYDFIFFDGFQIHYQFLPHYERLLKPDGILFLANNHLSSRTSEQFFQGLRDGTKWEILEQFADTAVAQRLP